MLELTQREWNRMATKYGGQIQELENKLDDANRRIKLLENLQLSEKEANILHKLYPELKKKVLEFEKVRMRDDKVWTELKKFIERNTIPSGYVTAIGITKKMKKLMERKKLSDVSLVTDETEAKE